MRRLSYLLFLATGIIIFNFSCKVQTPPQKDPMKNYNSGDYGSQWKSIDSLINKGLPKSALEKVNSLYLLATKDNNPSQIVKTLLFKSNLEAQLEEDGFVKAIERMRTEMEQTPLPAKAVLQSILAQKYNSYLQRNQWRLRKRTEIMDFKAKDIRTWSMANLLDESARLYLQSVKHDGLDKVPINNFDDIMYPGQNNEGLRPTLFDFLMHRAIDYFSNDQTYLNEPNYKFEIDQTAAFGNLSVFLSYPFMSADTSSKKYQAVLLFQKLLQKLKFGGKVKALVDADLKRLKFMYDQSILENKGDLYQAALEDIQKQFANNEVSAKIAHALANYYFQKGYSYKANPDDLGKWDFKKAYDICEKAIQKFPNSFGAKSCKNLQASILNKQLNVTAEEINMANKPILALIDYKNIKQVFVKVLAFDKDNRKAFDRMDYGKRLSYLNRLSSLQSASYQLPDDGDYRSHTTEIKIDPLNFGEYLVMVSDNEKFTDRKHVVNYFFIKVSNLFYWSRSNEDGAIELVITDRETGQPLSGVKATFTKRTYNSKKRSYDIVNVKELLSDADGKAKAQLPTRNSYGIILQKGNDILALNNYIYSYNRGRDNHITLSTQFFLDRAIYRPGQTLYFKAIVLKKNGKLSSSILANKTIDIQFNDANGQKIERKTLRTNEYGTVNGSFIAPQSGMLGYMQIIAFDGEQRIGNQGLRVEEYKRPKFELSFEPLKESFRLNEEVVVKASAKAFAGNNIDGAKVKYRVVREVVYPYWRWWSRWGYPQSTESMEIANGTTQTDEDGAFEIKFKAIPDKKISPKTKPQFNYRIYADVVDITGETQSSETTVSVGYIALKIDADIAAQINKDSLKNIKIISKNLNGEFEAASGQVKLIRLKTPDTVFKKRLWNKPDKPLIAKADFKKYFPNLPYENEDDVENWEQGNIVLDKSFDTRTKKLIGVNNNALSAGQYLLIIHSKDKYGEAVELKKYFKVYDLNSKKVPSNEMDFQLIEQKTFEPGDLVRVYKGTAADNIKVLFELEQNNKITQSTWMDIHQLESIAVKIVDEKDRGNFFYHFSFVKNNRVYQQAKTVVVPWSNKELKIEYQTFRNKLHPGQDEEWRIKISGPKKERVAAEMLATMYDASLDQFAVNSWYFSPFSNNYSTQTLKAHGLGTVRSDLFAYEWQPQGTAAYIAYRRLRYLDEYFGRPVLMKAQASGASRSRNNDAMSAAPPPPSPMVEEESYAESDTLVEKKIKDGEIEPPRTAEPPAPAKDLSDVKLRTNLRETVFFMPDLHTDAQGNILIKFKMNEALTRWKFLGLAHTKDLKYALTEKEIVTQKDLMVQPNPPRFFREDDVIEFTAKVSNLTEKTMTGTAQLFLFDALTMKPIDDLLDNKNANISFTAKGGSSDRLAWRIQIPKGKVMAVTHRVVARSGDFSDGEESSLPVLTNRMLVTETMPLAVRGGQEKTFVFQSLKDAAHSTTLTHHKMTLEFTSNPAWYAVQALPYIMEYPYECTEQIFSRLYANSLATSIANSHPKINRIFEEWKQADSDALVSNLSKNQELKSALLEETPWVLAAQNETEQKKNIALLFDLNHMAAQQEKAIGQLVERQLGNGGFAWFPGGRDSWYISQYLVEGIGHLKQLGVDALQADTRVYQLTNNALRYIDQRFVEHYKDLKKSVKRYKGKMSDDHLDAMAIHYLYTRSFFPDNKKSGKELNDAHDYYLAQAKKYWLKKGIYQEGMIALALHRNGDKKVVNDILKSLKERALSNEELGTYWKINNGFYWYEYPIETHALMIELFGEVGKDQKMVEELKVWLLKNKQTNHWKTTKATAAAIYALLVNGNTQGNWLLEDKEVDITIAGKTLDQSRIQKEAGTAYFKTAWTGDEITSSMNEIKVSNPNKVIAWGAAYWQYFEQLDKIKTFEETPLTLKKKLYKEVPSATGPKLVELSEGAKLTPGDKLKVRIELRVDRTMEYVHMKDMRASGFEPLNVLSRYKYQAGLGYYESTRDASTNFFFSYLPKGTHVFEYPLRVIHNGDFSNGVTTIQCMYAPEFTSHSEGIRVKVEGK